MVAEQKGFSASDHRRRVDTLGDELDKWRRGFDAAKSQAEDRRSHSDRRRFPRFLCRGVRSRVGLQFQPSFPGLKRDDTWRGALLCDVSRGGLQLLHSDLMFPQERLRVMIASISDIKGLLVEVRHCRRVVTRLRERACRRPGRQAARTSIKARIQLDAGDRGERQ